MKYTRKNTVDMPKIVCSQFYGYDCDFITKKLENSDVIDEFEKHATELHNVEFAKEALMYFILRQ